MVFSLCTSQISLQAKMVLGGSRKQSHRRHSGEGGAWQWYLISSISMALLGWLNEAHICHANFLQSGTPSNANSSLHQSGVSVASAFYITHSRNFPTGCTGGDSSSSELSTNLVRKEVTPGSNSSGSPGLNPLELAPLHWTPYFL